MRNNIPFDDDDLYVKLGRFRDDDQREIERALSYNWRGKKGAGRSRPSYLDKVVSLRGRAIANNCRPSCGRQVIVKAVGNTKSVSGTQAMVRYVARLRAEDRRNGGYGSVVMFDEFGRVMASDEVGQAITNWGMEANNKNLSKKARDLDPGKLARLSERQRLHYVQAWHFVYSIISEGDFEDDAELFRRVITVAVDRLYTAKGFRVLWAIHTDCESRPHAHLVVKAQSSMGERIRCDKAGDYLHFVRTELAGLLRSAGMDYDASRREDRMPVREKVARGEEPLRQNKKIMEYHGGGGGDLTHSVPQWQYRFGKSNRVKRILPITLKNDRNVPDGLRPLLAVLKGIYKNPDKALISWSFMAVEERMRDEKGKVKYPKRGLAIWYLKNRPNVFGALQDVRHKMNHADKIEEAISHIHWPNINLNIPSAKLKKLPKPVKRISDRQIKCNIFKITASLLRVAALTEVLFQNKERARLIRNQAVNTVYHGSLRYPVRQKKSLFAEAKAYLRDAIHQYFSMDEAVKGDRGEDFSSGNIPVPIEPAKDRRKDKLKRRKNRGHGR